MESAIDRPRPRIGRNVGIAFVAVVLIALIGLLGFGMAGGGKITGSVPVRTKVARDFTLPMQDGSGTLALSSLRGKPVVLNFWASWCLPCQQEAPVLEALSRRYADQGVVFLGVNVWDQAADAQTFVKQYGISYAGVLDSSGQTAINYGVSGIPETFFIDRNGNVVRHYIGPLADRQLAGFLDELLK